jgi:hypothetical protein
MVEAAVATLAVVVVGTLGAAECIWAAEAAECIWAVGAEE